MTEPTDEQHLDEYLKGDSSVSRQYRQLPSAEVPASLDRLVLRQAEDAVKRPSRRSWVRWTAPLAVAASAVLVVSIVMETGLRDETMVASPAVQAERAPVEMKMADEAASDAPVLNEEVANADKLEMPAPPPAAAPTVAPQAARARSAPAPVVPPVEPEAFPGGAVAYDEARAVLREEAAKRAPVVELSYSQAMNTSAVNNVATLQREYSDPEEWLKAIRQLRTENKQDEADREWRRFRSAFPDYAVAESDSAREAKK